VWRGADAAALGACCVEDGARAKRLQGQPRGGAVGTGRGTEQHGTGVPMGRAVRGVREQPRAEAGEDWQAQLTGP